MNYEKEISYLNNLKIKSQFLKLGAGGLEQHLDHLIDRKVDFIFKAGDSMEFDDTFWPTESIKLKGSAKHFIVELEKNANSFTNAGWRGVELAVLNVLENEFLGLGRSLMDFTIVYLDNNPNNTTNLNIVISTVSNCGEDLTQDLSKIENLLFRAIKKALFLKSSNLDFLEEDFDTHYAFFDLALETDPNLLIAFFSAVSKI